jgi:hypothetical protein
MHSNDLEAYGHTDSMAFDHREPFSADQLMVIRDVRGTIVFQEKLVCSSDIQMSTRHSSPGLPSSIL